MAILIIVMVIFVLYIAYISRVRIFTGHMRKYYRMFHVWLE